MPKGKGRTEFTPEHDTYLYKYLAVYCPTKEGRHGRRVYENLVADENRHNWPWAVHHSWQSWRERYVRNSAAFDNYILRYQRKRSVKPTSSRKRPAESMPGELPKQSAKRVRLEEEESSESETNAGVQHEKAGPSQSQSMAKSLPRPPRDPPETPSQVPQARSATAGATTRHENAGLPPSESAVKSLPNRPSEPAETPSKPPNSTQATSAPRTDATSTIRRDASTGVTKRPAASQSRDDVLEIPSSSPDRRAPLVTEPDSPPRHVKRIKVRRDTSPDIFVSEPSSPRNASASVEGRPPPVPASVQPRAPPRVVDSLHGQVLVDREGHVPRTLPRGGKPMTEEEGEEEQNKVQWPPVRGHTTKQKRASGPDAKADAHHAFSQPQPPPRPDFPPQAVEGSKREQTKQTFDRRAIADRFAGPARPLLQAENGPRSEPRDNETRNGASPVKRIVTAAASSNPFSGPAPKFFAKSLSFPAPRASTRSPFRPEPSTKQTTSNRPPLPEPRPRPPSRTRVARHPDLTRVRRQTIANEREHQRQVPSVDLVSLSRASTNTSARSHSRSSTGTSVPARPPRWSLPAFAQATPWVFDAPPLAHSDPWHPARTSSLVGTSTPRFALTPSPARSMGGMNGAPSNGSGVHAHPTDVSLTSSHGLALLLAHMSANHGLALGVVEAVYERVGSLKEADEVLRGMREAAEGFGEREIERRLRARRGGREGSGAGRMERRRERKRMEDRGRMELRYVVASEDGEGSEYSPPETSRAAMWKRQSESSYVEEEGDEEEGREVEEELRNLDENEDDSDDETHHDFSRHIPLPREDDENTSQDRDDDGEQDVPRHRGTAWEGQKLTVLLGDTRTAQEVERRLGKGRYRKDIAKLFS